MITTAVSVELMNDDGDKREVVEHVSHTPDESPGTIVHEAIEKARTHATEDTGDDSWEMNNWAPA